MRFRFEVYALSEGKTGFGFRIYSEEKVIIEQPHIPAVSGNVPFQSAQHAASAAQLMMHKLEHKIFPPTITPLELDSLGISCSR
jgi:hypothetical protein